MCKKRPLVKIIRLKLAKWKVQNVAKKVPLLQILKIALHFSCVCLENIFQDHVAVVCIGMKTSNLATLLQMQIVLLGMESKRG